jgi:hypothetical protein
MSQRRTDWMLSSPTFMTLIQGAAILHRVSALLYWAQPVMEDLS